MTEKILCNAIIEYLNYSGLCYVWRVNSGVLPMTYKGKTRMVRLAQKGTSDIQGIRKRDGRFICLEVKVPGKEKTLTQLQRDYLLKMKNYHSITGMVTSEEEAREILQREEL